MGFRVIKTTIATVLAIVIAHLLGILNPLSAGLLAILGVDVTRKRSIHTVSSRFFASIMGLVMSSVLFYIFGFHIWVLAVYILIGFPLISRANLKEGIVTSSVVVFRVFGGEDVSFEALFTQILLLIIGLGSAVVVNLIYMPNEEDKLTGIRRKVDSLFGLIFERIASQLRDPDYVWDGQELIEASREVELGLSTANRALDNQVIAPDEAWAIYFYMRKQQLDRIESMLQLISQVYQRMPQGEKASVLFDQLSIDVKRETYTGNTEHMLQELEKEFKAMELPHSREEFEIRSAILQLCRELALYLDISRTSKYPTEKSIRKRAVKQKT
ncbi:aromatic acid exporter family protein [Paenibacillus sp. YPG26]|uniref:aromatic acid exporter family protein n=1 Tax=Paenibacillus sp. YPG26 TaxID=2878915 RepID=UPI0020421554|nr:aromatic acid exporter family protein [Paenibacillus sp. YPG26]USB34871.1 aromatic acid exporter family protein [Paenibacillus sp. YPG26]